MPRRWRPESGQTPRRRRQRPRPSRVSPTDTAWVASSGGRPSRRDSRGSASREPNSEPRTPSPSHSPRQRVNSSRASRPPTRGFHPGQRPSPRQTPNYVRTRFQRCGVSREELPLVTRRPQRLPRAVEHAVRPLGTTRHGNRPRVRCPPRANVRLQGRRQIPRIELPAPRADSLLRTERAAGPVLRSGE
jgi:hypothetical protein